MQPKIEFISATPCTQQEFSKTLLGRSFQRLQHESRMCATVAFANRRGLSEVYNEQIRAKSDPDMVIFVHDDVWIDDYFIYERIIEGLEQFDIIGVAGNTRMTEGHTTWFKKKNNEWDAEHLSGRIAFGEPPFLSVLHYGEVRQNCVLMDGVFFATRRSTLIKNNVFFDPQFKFHFYDLDFCRTAHAAGLSMGTWPIAISHSSDGAFGSPSWQEGARLYRRKWPTP
ncbi:MAG: glycosyltransferase [Bacteroidota bacterium]